MKAEDVAQYLQDNPKFFEQHVETLTQINLPHPHGGRTISLSERQLLALREKNKELEKKLRELMVFAQENDALQNKVHEFVVALFAARDLAALQAMIPYLLRDIFVIPHAAMHLWQLNPPAAELQTFADAQSLPACLHRAMSDTSAWFGDRASQLQSYAYLPLRVTGSLNNKRSAVSSLRDLKTEGGTIGMLLLASEEKQRFYPGMGTVFLQRIAEAVSSALHPHLISTSKG